MTSGGLYYDPADIDSLPWRSRSYIHEVGHLLNLAHPNAADQGSGAQFSNPIMETNNSQTSIQPGDIIAAQHIFGPATNAPETVPDVVATLSASLSGGTITATWTAPVINGGLSVTGYRVRWYLNDVLQATELVTGTSATRTHETGTWRVRVQAVNSEGDGLAKEDTL